MRRALAIMARTPKLHATKTRLQAELGAKGALQAHVQLVEATLARVSALRGVAVSLWVTQVDQTTQAWSERGDWPLCLQPAGDLGERMHRILRSLLEQGTDRACLIGTDCPEINADYIETAFYELDNADVVIGPAEDGGYGLIGMNAPHAALFADVGWGGSDVLTVTLAKAEAAGLHTHLLPTIWDVDTPADWRRYQVWSEQHSNRRR